MKNRNNVCKIKEEDSINKDYYCWVKKRNICMWKAHTCESDMYTVVFIIFITSKGMLHSYFQYTSNVWLAWVRPVMDLFTLDDIHSFYFITHNPPVQDLKACDRCFILYYTAYQLLCRLLNFNCKVEMNEFVLLVEPMFWAMPTLCLVLGS